MAAHYKDDRWSAAIQLSDLPAGGAAAPRLAVDPGGAPWAIWAETAPDAPAQIVVRRAGHGADPSAADSWEPIGRAGASGRASLNRDPARAAHDPDIVVGETAWAIWQETSAEGRALLFAAQAVGDLSAAGEVDWRGAGPARDCADETCALNRDPAATITGARVAIGAVPGDTLEVPWVVSSEQGPDGRGLVYVSRYDPDGERFIPVGEALNANTGAAAGAPSIAFAGRVAFVSWREGAGEQGRLFVAHLADARPGFERWDLDTPEEGILGTAEDNPALATDGRAPSVFWREGTGLTALRLFPDNGSWGSNYPPYIRIISPDRAIDTQQFYVLWPAEPATSQENLEFTDVRTTCNNILGWANISEIQFTVTDGATTLFSGRYRSEGDIVEVQDLGSGEWLGGAAAGSGEAIATTYATLDVPGMRVESLGADSPAADLYWRLAFSGAPPGRYAQQLRILTVDGTDTGFFTVGELEIRPVRQQG